MRGSDSWARTQEALEKMVAHDSNTLESPTSGMLSSPMNTTDENNDGVLKLRPNHHKHRHHKQHHKHHRHHRSDSQNDVDTASIGFTAGSEPSDSSIPDPQLVEASANPLTVDNADDAALDNRKENSGSQILGPAMDLDDGTSASIEAASAAGDAASVDPKEDSQWQIPSPVMDSDEGIVTSMAAVNDSLSLPQATGSDSNNSIMSSGLTKQHRHHKHHHSKSKRVSHMLRKAGTHQATSPSKLGTQDVGSHATADLGGTVGVNSSKSAKENVTLQFTRSSGSVVSWGSGTSAAEASTRARASGLKRMRSVLGDILKEVQEPAEQEQSTSDDKSSDKDPAEDEKATDEKSASDKKSEKTTDEKSASETTTDEKSASNEKSSSDKKSAAPPAAPAAAPAAPAAAPATASQEKEKQAKNGKMGSPEEEEKKVEILEDEIEEETHSEGLAEMLGGIKMNIVRLNERVRAMHEELKDGVTLEEPDTDLTVVHPLSTTMQCIINLTIQYFLIYTAFAVVCSFQDCMGISNTMAYQALKSACDTVIYAPMLCVLFLGTRMRALQITQGKGDPPMFAQIAMQVCTWAVLIQTSLALAIPLFTGQAAQLDDDGNVIPVSQNPAVAGLLMLTKYAAMLGQYIGISVICVAVFMMDARTLKAEPRDLWDNPETSEVEYSPPVSPAVSCTMNLTAQFFAVYLAYSIVTTLIQFFRPGSDFSDTMLRWKGVLDVAKYTVNMAPMLCILFIGARMRALQLDPKNGNPQAWAQMCFYLCTYSILVQTLMVILVPVLGLAEPEKNPLVKGDVKFVAKEGVMNFILSGVRLVALLCLYGGFTAVIFSVIIIEAPRGKVTPPVSPTMQCVICLTMQYFFVYLCLFVALLMHEHVRPVMTTLHVLEAAENTIKFCPMLAVLFVGTRMRALELSKQKGSPQCWAQDAMYIASAATLAQLCLALLLGIFVGGVEADENGNPRVEIRWMPGRALVDFLRCLTFIGLYGGVVTVIISVLIISPDSAHCAKGGFIAIPQIVMLRDY